MGNVFIDESILQGWADTIREMLGITTKMKPSELLEKTKTELDDKDLLRDYLARGIVGDYYNESLTTLRNYAFAGNAGMISVNFPNVTTVPLCAFEDCSGLTSVSLPKANIARALVFAYCSALKDVNLPVLKTMTHQVFYYCDSLKTIEIPLLEESGQRVFAYCKSLESVDLPLLQNAHAYQMFYECSALKTISMPALTSIAEMSSTSMFYNCKALENIILGSECFTSDMSFAYSPLLTDESIQNIINALAIVETSKTLTLHADVKAKLTEEQLATIASKNWTVK